MKNIQQTLFFFFSILLLGTQTSCVQLTKVSTDKNNTEKIERIPFEITKGNNIKFKTILNGVDTLDLYFDTGGTEIVLQHHTIKNRTSLLDGKNKSYKEEDYTPLEELNTLSIGSMTWDTLTIYPVRIGPKETDGHFGWNLFENKIVELDYDNQFMTVYPSLEKVPEGYVKLELEYINTLFCVQGTVNVDGKDYTDRYLFDTGFQRSIILDKDLRKKSNFPTDLPVIKESKLRNGVGTEFINQVIIADKFCFGTVCTNDLPIQLLGAPNPARFETHILGNEFLKRYNTIFDFKNNFVYLKPNTLMNLPYVDAS